MSSSTTKWRPLVVALCALTLLTACASSSSDQGGGTNKGTLRVAFFNPVSSNTFTTAGYRGAVAAGKKFNAKVTEFDAKFDAATQITQMQDAIVSKKFDIFIVNPLNNAGLVPVAEQAQKAGIQVVSVLSTIGTDIGSLKSSVDGVITVGSSLSKNGQLTGDLVVKACAGINPCKIGYMPGDPRQATEKIRLDAFHKVIKSNPSIKIVAEQPGGFDAATGLKTAQDILTAHPDLNVLAGSASQSIAGAAQAVAKLKLKDIKLVSDGGTVEDVAMIKNGTIFGAAVLLPFTEGYTGLQLGTEAVRGKKVALSTETTDLTPIGQKFTGDVLDKAALETPEGAAFTGEYSAG